MTKTITSADTTQASVRLYQRGAWSISAVGLRRFAYVVASGFLTTVGAFAQYGPGWIDVPQPEVPEPVDASLAPPPRAPSAVALSSKAPRRTVFSGPVSITPELQALARGLQNDPVAIFNYVRNKIRYQPYFGSAKGAHGTWLDEGGNNMDQASLLIALLGAAGFTDAVYVSGPVSIRESWSDGFDVAHWFGCSPALVPMALAYSGATNGRRTNLGSYILATFDHIWVRVTINGVSYDLDPSLKFNDTWEPMDLKTISGYSKSQVLADAGGTVNGASVKNINQAALESRFAQYSAAIRTHLAQNHPDAGIEEVIGGSRIREEKFPSLAAAAEQLARLSPSPTTTFSVPASGNRARLNVVVGSQINSTFQADELAGRRLSLTFNGSNAQLWLGDVLHASETNGSGTTANVTYSITHGDGFTQNLGLTRYDRNGRYDLTYSLHPNPLSGRRIAASNDRIRAYLTSGLADSSREVLTETLHQFSLQWVRRVAMDRWLFAHVSRARANVNHIIGRAEQQSSYSVDMPGVYGSAYDAVGTRQDVRRAMVWAASAMEHGVIEQLTGTPSVSTVKCLALANELGQDIYRVTSANWPTVSGSLQNYSTNAIANIASYANTPGNVLLVHRATLNVNQWSGHGFSSVSTNSIGMMISGGLSGGNGTKPADLSGESVSGSVANVPIGHANVPPTLSAEPVDLATGAYTMDALDLAIGDAETPRGLLFRRSYDSHRRSERGALGRGWQHSCHGRVTLASNLEVAYGSRLATEATDALVVAMLSPDFVGDTAPVNELMVAPLAANWLVDRITDNSAMVEISGQRLAYTSKAEGGWLPSPGSTTMLTGSPGSFVLQPRFGGSIVFDAQNRVSQWKDVDDNTQTFAYDGTNRLTTVTDSQGRSLNFSYLSPTSPLLSSVSDSTGRTVSFSYTGENLTEIIDPAGFRTSLTYDAENRLTHWRDHENALLVINTYDEQDRVIEQLSQGDPARRWQFLYATGQTREVNPLGEITTYEFDHLSRLVGRRDGLGNRTATTYDNQNQRVAETDATGRTVTRIFDGNLNLISSTDPAGEITTRQYDSALRLSKVTDPTGRATEFAYDSKNRMTRITDPGGRVTTMEYRPDGRLTRINHPDNSSTLYTAFDQWANPTGVTRPDGTTTTSVFNARGDLVGFTDGRGKTTSMQYDVRRLITRRTDADNKATVWTYDSHGRPASTTDRNGQTTTMVHDNFGKLQSVTAPDTGTVTYEYDLADRLIRAKNALNHTVTTGYDAAGRPVSTTDALGITTQSEYDAAGRVSAALDGRGKASQFFYDEAGRLSHTLDPMNRRVDHTYDEAGRTLTLQNQNRRTFTSAYGADGLATTFTYPSGRQSAITARDGAGRPKTLQKPSGEQTALTHDAAGRVKTQADSAGTISYTYDAEGNPTSVAEGSKTITRTFDNLGRVLTCTDTLGQTVAYTYDNEGNVATLTYPGNRTVTYTYDGANRLKTVTDWAGRLTTYTYDTIGRLIQVDRPNGTRERRQYDAANRLVATFDERGAVAIWQAAYAFDNADRITQFSAMPAPRPYAPPPATMTYDVDNRLATYNGAPVASDANGNLLAAPLNGTLLGNLGWDVRNRLTTAGNTTYAYDAEGRRTTRTIAGQTTAYTWSRGAALDRLLVVNHPDGSVTRYVHGIGLAYEEHTPAGGGTPTTTFYHYNWQGSTVALTDGSGNVTARLSYNAYGERTVESGNVTTPFCFNGQWGVLTEPNGLYHHQARFYSPILRRFLSEDPIGFAGGVNIYAYTGGDPANLVDPFGLGPSSLSYFYKGLVNAFAPEAYKRLTDDEKSFVKNSPFVAWDFKTAADEATAEAKKRFPDSLHNGSGDAFRHAYWNALMTKARGPELAKQYADAHENFPGNDPNEKTMDLINNSLGRLIGVASRNSDNRLLADLVEQALKDGMLKTELK